MTYSTEGMMEVVAVLKEQPEIDARLLSMLEWARPHKSKTLEAWAKIFIEHPYGKADDYFELRNPKAERLAICIDVPMPNGDASRTMFSCHIDTIHRTEGQQEVIYAPDISLVYKNDKEPLGADDTAGVWLMLEMIDAGVPGMYVFHEGEERGGWGSSQIADYFPHFLSDYDHAIAFDRRGTKDVITHQGWQRCCSDEFAQELSARLTAATGYSMEPCDGGIFTDTRNYTEDIPECTNISVGYENEHSGSEMLDVEFLMVLRDAVTNPATWENLPVKRDPKVIEDLYPDYGFSGKAYATTTSLYANDKYNVYADVKAENLRDMDEYDIAEWLYNVDAEEAARVIWLATRR